MVEAIDIKPIWRTVWFALLICGLVLGFSLLPACDQWIQTIDQQAARWLNDRAGLSPVFDRLVLLIADDDGIEGLALLAAIWFVTTLWMAPTRVEKSRVLGTLLFVIIVLVLYFLVDSLLDDVIERKSPSMEFLHPFHSIRKILDYDVDLTSRRTFPNIEAMILFSIGFMLLRLGRLRGGFVALALGATVPLLLCVAGLSWVTDIYMGALPLALLVSAIALETPFSRLLGSLIDLSAAAIDQTERSVRNILPMWRHRRLYWTSQKAFHMEVAVKRFAARDLPEILDPEKRNPNEIPSLLVPLGGLRSVIRIATLGPLRGVIRAYPLSHRSDAEQHFRASTLLSQHGVRVPAIYHRTENADKYGALFIVEEFIEGRSKTDSELTDADIAAAARELARLHKVTSAAWGPVDLPRTEDYETVLLRRLDRQLTQVVRGPILQSQRGDVASVRAWYNSWRQELATIKQFSLIHGKLHRENCIFETGGGFCLLDVTTLEWGVPAVDLVLLHHSQCGDDPEICAKFDTLYYAEMSAAEAAARRHLMPLFEAIYCLGQIHKHTKRLGRVRGYSSGNHITKGVGWWQQLLEIVQAEEGGK